METNKYFYNLFIKLMNERNFHDQVTLLMQNGYDDWELIRDLNI